MTIDKALLVRAQDGEQLLTQSMGELLTLPAECSLVALKPAHSSRLLPASPAWKNCPNIQAIFAHIYGACKF
jgi:hypothetical protein